MKKVRNRRLINTKTKIIFFIVLFISAFFYIDFTIRPVVVTIAQYQIQSLINKAVNNAIIDVMGQTQFSYNQLVDIVKNDNQEIVSVNYNSLNINKLRSELVKATMEETNKLPVTNVYIAIGNITKIDILQNKGPKLKFTITPSSYVEADVESVFEHTGINQVNHRVFIILKVTANALIPNYSTSVYSENKVCVAETVIIGKVPDNIGNGIVYSDN